MANAVFTTKVSPTYDDLPEVRYHFPRTYLNFAQQTVGDWILYYEPRREDSSLAGRAGRSAYFATACVRRIEPDPLHENHFYAFVSEYLEFVEAVPFRSDDFYPESGLMKANGSTNKGAFGRAIRLLPRQEFEMILQVGLSRQVLGAQEAQEVLRVAEEPMAYGTRRQTTLVERPARDAVFTRTIQDLYQSTCALTGLRIINGGGRCEIEAAHIRPVAAEGPDSTRNGLALSRTVHWLFDRGIVSLDDEGRILAAPEYLPEPVGRLLNPDRKMILPTDPTRRPHPVYLGYHRQVVCQGKNLRLLE